MQYKRKRYLELVIGLLHVLLRKVVTELGNHARSKQGEAYNLWG